MLAEQERVITPRSHPHILFTAKSADLLQSRLQDTGGHCSDTSPDDSLAVPPQVSTVLRAKEVVGVLNAVPGTTCLLLPAGLEVRAEFQDITRLD